MGKKITLDFSKVEERSGWNTKEMPEGLHEFKIELVDLKDASDGTAMWTYGLRPTNPKYKTRLFPYYCKHQQNQLFKLRDIFIAAGLTVPKKKQALDPEAPVNKIIAAEVTDATGQYAGRSEIDGVYTTDILEGDESAGDDGDEEEYDEEDVDADEVDEDEEEDDEEVDDEELREEIEALTLAALRKRAKALDIDTEGVKKDDLVELVIEEELGLEEEEDDEDDLDDEELDDDELEDEEFEDDEDDEEEEEEPVKPVRKTTSKAPAKAATKAAPAKRVVRRR
jgi:hypothetical protein